MFLRLWSLKGVGINITCHQNPPPGFCQRFCAGGEKGNFEWKNVRRHQGKWGTKVSGTGDTCIDRTVGVSQRIFWQPLVPHHPWTALSPSSSPVGAAILVLGTFHILNLCPRVGFSPSPTSHHRSPQPGGAEGAGNEASHSPLPEKNLCSGQEGGPSCRHQQGG